MVLLICSVNLCELDRKKTNSIRHSLITFQSSELLWDPVFTQYKRPLATHETCSTEALGNRYRCLCLGDRGIHRPVDPMRRHLNAASFSFSASHQMRLRHTVDLMTVLLRPNENELSRHLPANVFEIASIWKRNNSKKTRVPRSIV